MEKIERLANLNPKTGQVSGHSLEMFRLLRSYAMLDWVLRHPNDLGKQRSEVKFEKLIERTWQLMDAMQSEIEALPEPEERLVTLGKHFHAEPD